MSADIEKLAVFDSRIVQSRPKYAVEKGALSLTNAPFNAISATSSQHTYNIYVPSENVFVDRGMEWTSQVTMTFSSVYTALPAAGLRVCSVGTDWSLCAFPLTLSPSLSLPRSLPLNLSEFCNSQCVSQLAAPIDSQ